MYEKTKDSLIEVSLVCDPGGILTPNRWSRNPVLYTVELRSLLRPVVQIQQGLSYGA